MCVCHTLWLLDACVDVDVSEAVNAAQCFSPCACVCELDLLFDAVCVCVCVRIQVYESVISASLDVALLKVSGRVCV